MSLKKILLLLFITSTFGNLIAQTKDTLSYSTTQQILFNKDYAKAMQQFLQLSQRYQTEGNQQMLSKSYERIGVIFKKNKEYNKARSYYFKALKICANKRTEISLYKNLASINYQESRLDSSVYYYNKILNDTAFFKFEKNIADTHKNLGGIYIKQKKSDSAIHHLTLAKAYLEQNNQPKKLINLYNNIASIHYINKDFSTAKDVYEKAYALLNDSTSIYYKYSIAENLRNCYYRLNQINIAEKYDDISILFQDSIHRLEFNEKVTEIEAIHNEDKARAEEAIKTEQQREAKQRTQYALAGTGMLSLIIILIGTNLYRNSKLKAKTLALNLVEQELTQQKTLRLLEEKNQSKLLNATLDGRETERKDIAQTLHDSVSALLSSANMHLQVAKKKSTTPIDELEKSQRIIDEASGKVRDLSHKLISAVLLKFGLEHAVYDMCEKYSNSALEFELESEDKIPRFEQNFEIKLHNIIEECINNIIKHSKASEASVTFLLKNNLLYVRIKDNGVGFDTSKISPSSGIGLSQIIARVESLGGTFNIQSTLNSGTDITFDIPVIMP